MNKNKKYDAVNNQEDEDGYGFFPDYPINDGTIKMKPGTGSRGAASNTEPGSSKPARDESEWLRNYIHSPSAKLEENY